VLDWLLIFQCEYSDFYSLLSIGHTALWIVFFSSSDHRYLWTVPYGASDCPLHPLFFNIDFFFMYTTFCNFLCITVLESERIQNRPPPWLTIGLGNRLSGVYVTSENDQLAYENTNIRFMMNLLFTHYIYMYIEITTLIDT
jgi:hypothetical protein